MGEIKSIIFDFDGTLVESVDLYVDAFINTFKEYGISVSSEEVRRLIGYSAKKMFRIILSNKGRLGELESIFSSYRKKVLSEEYILHIKLKRGVKEILRLFRRKKISMFIVSGSNKKIMLSVLEREGIINFFEEVISTSDDAFDEKPSPTSISYILKKYDLQKGETLFIGDGPLDYEMAKSAGISFIGIKGIIDEKHAIENDYPLIYNFYELKRLLSKILICFVGMPGSGKSTAREICCNILNVPYIRFGDVTDEFLKKSNLTRNEDNERKIRELLRQKYGMEAYAKLSFDKIKKALDKNRICVIDGLYSWEEYLYLEDILEDVEIVLVGIMAHRMQRYFRIASREVRALKPDDVYIRDLSELKKLNKAFPIVMADYFICNTRDKEALEKSIKQIVRDIVLFQ